MLLYTVLGCLFLDPDEFRHLPWFSQILIYTGKMTFLDENCSCDVHCYLLVVAVSKNTVF